MNYSIEAEQALLGACLKDPTVMESVTEKLTPESFFNKDNQVIFQSMIDLTSNGKAVDIISVAEEVAKTHGEKLAYLYQLGQSPCAASNVKAYRDMISDRFTRRSLSALLSSTINDLSNPSKDTDLLISSLAGHLGAVQGEDQVNIRTTNEILKTTIQEIDKRFSSDGKMIGLPTGLECLDNRYLGLGDGELIVIAGRPSMGKSALSWQIAINAALNNKNMHFFALEMTSNQLMERAMANVGHIHLGHLKDPKGAPEDMWNKLSIAGTKLRDKPMTIDETPMLHINQICARARAKHRIKPLELVVVYHIGLVRADGESRNLQVAQISGALKALAKELNCPVIAVSQLNRDVEKRNPPRPQMSDLRDSGAVEQDADKVILMYREDYYNEETINPGILEIITGKFREGETGTDLVAHRLHECRVLDLHPDYRPIEKKAQGFAYG